MPWWGWTLVGVALVYIVAVAVLAATGRGSEAKALVRLVPDCLVLSRRLLADPRLGRRHKAMLAALVLYLASPIDLVPDFIPVAGYADDALLVALVLRRIVRAAGPEIIRELWPGPEPSLALVLRAAGVRDASYVRADASGGVT